MSQSIALLDSPDRFDDEIPLTDRHWRERWGQELTRANELERKLREAERSAADWQAIALSNGEQLAHAQVDLARRDLDVAALNEAREAWVARSQANFTRADKLAAYIETMWDDEGLTVNEDHVRELIEAAGVDCEKCGGDGTRWVDDGSDTRNPMVREDCEACFGVGRNIR